MPLTAPHMNTALMDIAPPEAFFPAIMLAGLCSKYASCYKLEMCPGSTSTPFRLRTVLEPAIVI